MELQFFTDPLQTPNSREDVRLKQLGLYVYPDRRRVAVGFDLTPFLERPSLEVTITNEKGEEAGSLNVIETLEANFSLVMHLRDQTPTQQYRVAATVYYVEPGEPREVVHAIEAPLNITQPGDQTYKVPADK